MAKTEEIIVANLYVGNQEEVRLRRWLSWLGFHIVIISELGSERMINELSKAGKVFYNRKETKPHDVAVLVSSTVMSRSAGAISWIGRQLTRFIRRPHAPAKRLWRDRWFVRVRIWGRVYYSIHANAAIVGPEGNWLDNRGADAWREALVKLQDMIRDDIKAGLRVRVAGDFNISGESDAENSPADFFEELGMKHVNDRVMWFGWNPKTDELVKFKILPTAPGADAHAVLHVTLRRR